MSTEFSENNEEPIIPEELPLLPIRDVVVYPYMILPLFVGRESSIKAVNEALSKDRLIFLAAQKEITDEHPSPDAIYPVGTVAMIMRMRRLPDGRIKILVQGLTKGTILNYPQEKPFFNVRIKQIQEPVITRETVEVEALMRTVKEQLEKVISLGRMLSPDILMVVDDINDAGRLADLIASNLGLKVNEAQEILELFDPADRLKKIHEILVKELEVLAMQARIRSNARDEMTKSQREYFLREQIRAIKNELGDTESKTEEIQELRNKVENSKMPDEVREEALKQLGRLERMHQDASEATIVRTYLDWLIEIPWGVFTHDTLDLDEAQKILDEDHFDLKKIKERILEFLAVRKLKPNMKGPILCFVGPPGVGKTSLGKSIARAMGRKFIRISLGGIRDEADIRGHRRTYVGALPGRIIQGLKQAGSANPIFMLDEIDKLGADFRGDPASALLEVLDPEQNFSFRDHYLNLPFDLSHVMFIATANLIDPVPSALRDRMEVIQLSGYSQEEKLKITKQFLVEKQAEENGLKPGDLQLPDAALARVIEQYTQEAGLRNLERHIAAICRKVARKIASAKDGKRPVTEISPKDVPKYLGPPKYLREEERDMDEVGVATGLAWTQFGGEILNIEVTKMRKNGGGLILTGSLGDVMKESAQAALSFVRTNSALFGISDKDFARYEIHVHVPQGATPKDGPSAGVTLTTAIISLLTGNPVRKDVAMTGEVTLRGKVLPVGGIKEKVLAAMRQGIKTLILPYRNQKDLDDIPKEMRKKVKFVFAKELGEVLKAALVHEPAEWSKQLSDPELDGQAVPATTPRSAKSYHIA
ncbi:MAG: endopeptidase La [Bdellovibrionaceae bacterium]|nr:endopeptidase La [Bdellovibrionales bacterium]MCB9253114.1 endopeptidase La [Pseudobdellovibrionaceae bacterium]